MGAAYAWHAGRSVRERELGFRAQALALDVARELMVSKAALHALATSPSLAAGDFEAFRQQLLRMPKPDGARIVLTDTAGRVWADSGLPPGAALTEAEVQDFCRGQIAHQKIPRYVRFVDEFPMTVTGKMQKFLMREAMERELGLRNLATA